MNVHLIDGTYELFRAHFGAPAATAPDGREVGATLGFLRSMIQMVRFEGATHLACAFDTVIESFRNDLFDGYKTGDGIDPALLAQFPLAERAAACLGFVVWPMVRFEADDAIATGAYRFAQDERVETIFLCSPDKDLAQCVLEDRIVMLDRMRRIVLDETGVKGKYGVPPASIPDWLALVGDAADGIPGIRGWGKKSASAVLSRYGSLLSIPPDPSDWDVPLRGAAALGANLAAARGEADLYKRLATLRRDAGIEESVGDLEWRGAPEPELRAFCDELGAEGIIERVPRWKG